MSVRSNTVYFAELELKQFFHVILTLFCYSPILEVYVIVSYNNDGSFTLEAS